MLKAKGLKIRVSVKSKFIGVKLDCEKEMSVRESSSERKTLCRESNSLCSDDVSVIANVDVSRRVDQFIDTPMDIDAF